MTRFFNIGGPCNPGDHYMLPAAERLHDENVLRLIAQKSYFVVHAPRQTGKTTAMLEFARTLTASGNYIAAVLSMEVGAAFPSDIEKAENAILGSWLADIRWQLPLVYQPTDWQPAPIGQQIGTALEYWSRNANKPLVVFLDEIDALENEVLISVLRQLRKGYYARPQDFPHSLALIGLRDVRDYKIASGGSERLSSPSPFNIAVRSIILRNFDQSEVRTLLLQHSEETGQAFSKEAIAKVYYLTQGQPWLVNALAKLTVEDLATDVAQPITAEHIEKAKEILIQRRQTHLDQLADKLRLPRIRRVIEPIMAGGSLTDVPQDDIDYAIDLGLCRSDPQQGLVIANPIYREVLPRTLAVAASVSIPYQKPIWLTAEGRLDSEQLLQAFLSFWRQHGQPLLQATHYHEIAPHLVLMAFLDRVANGGGTLDREYAIGSDKMDLFLRYGVDRLAIELKVWREGRIDPLPQGLQQLDGYLSGLGMHSGWLVIFDQRSGLPEISERTTTESAVTPLGRSVTVIRA